MDEIQLTLGKILATQDAILDGLKIHFEDDKKNFSEITERIQHVETKMNYAAGAAAVIVTGISFFWNFILTQIRGT